MHKDRRPIRILLLTGDESDAALLRGLLEAEGGEYYDLRRFEDDTEAMQRLRGGAADVCIIRYEAQPNGLDFIRAASAEGIRTPLILLMSGADLTMAVESIKAGATDCLYKFQLSAAVFGRTIRYALERAHITEELVRSEAEARKLALVASRTDNAVILTDSRGRIEWVNDSFTRITGYTMEEVVGRTPGSFLQGPRTDRETVARIRSIIDSGEGFSTELINYSKSGREYWIAIEVQPVCDAAGRVVHFMAIESDITERKKAEAELQLRERAMGAASEGIVITDPGQPGNPIIYVNAGFEQITGYSRQEAIGRNCRFLQGPGTEAGALDSIRAAIAETHECVVELLNYRRDGTPFWNRLSITPVRDAKGVLTHYLGIQSDITASKEAEQKLAAANAEVLAANKKMRQSLKAAAQIQRAFLPTKLPEAEGVHFAYVFEPSEELAGDSLNILELEPDVYGLYVLDVSGHGVPAALMSVAINRLLSAKPDDATSLLRRRVGPEARQVLVPPSEVAAQLNLSIGQDPEFGQYLTLIYGILNRQTRQFCYVSAGHPGPIRVPKEGPAVIAESPTGMPIGLLEGAYEQRSLDLAAGDRMYLYSDGITEAMNADGETFGTVRLLRVLEQARVRPLRESLAAVLAATESWRGSAEGRDDTSILACEVG
jgi:phosphoserine phosphatase RsbU/P